MAPFEQSRSFARCTPHEEQLTCRGSLLAEPRDRASDAVARFNLT